MSGLIWVTWRQQRALLATALAVIAAFALSAVLEHRADWTFGFTSATRTLAAFLPVALGLLWGVPLLAGPLENGTADLLWTQTVSRVRSLAYTLTVVLAASLTVSLAVLAILPLALGHRYGLTFTYDVESAVAVGYVLFAVALGLFAGAVLGRVEPAMAATAVVYGAVRLLMGRFRLHLLPIQHRTLTFEQAADFDRDLITSTWVSRKNDILVTYQTGERLARIQWIELGIYTALAAALVAGTLVVITRRGTR